MQNHASRIPLHVSRFTPHASRLTPHERGVALVVTLVLLSIITFMAVTFLVLSRSQHGSVATETDQQVARLAADTARERAIAALVAPILATTNEFNYGLLVSTNYISSAGFISGLSSPTNVSYSYLNGAPLNPADFLQNLTNLLYDPRPPVFIVTNALAVKSNEFRFFLDLNRNGFDDPNGLQPVVVQPNPPGPLYFYDLSGNLVPYSWPPPPNILSNFFIGDPEWIGGLRHPEFTHSADNPFVYRYAYIALPVGQSLDMNIVGNDGKQRDMSQPGDGFFRDQGLLTAEINLGAFLADLNTNMWPSTTPNPYNFAPYSYSTSYPPLANTGAAFDDAYALLRYRYAGNLASLAHVSGLGGLFANGAAAFSPDTADFYLGGPLMSGTAWPPLGYSGVNQARVNAQLPWSGAYNTNHFYTTQDWFDQNKTRPPWLPLAAPSLTDRLLIAGAQTNSYDRYTFYRLLSQLGTDTAPEPGGKMNVNYCNVDNNGYVVPNMATNFISWQAAQFFTNAAMRLLADAGYTVGDPNYATNLLVRNYVNGVLVTNLQIPIWPTNFYTPSVHRLLQLAANMYDATTNRVDFNPNPPYPHLPTVFLPMFKSASIRTGNATTNGIYIVGYREVNVNDMNALVGYAALWPLDLSILTSAPKTPPFMVYGVPLVIGAKKGLPNFNEFAMQSQVQVTRKLQFHRPGTSTTAPVNEMDQMFVAGISNVFGVEAWNSYAAPYPRTLELRVWPDITVLVTNLETSKLLRISSIQPTSPTVSNIVGTAWTGFAPQQPQYSLKLPLMTNWVFLSNMTYQAAGDAFIPLTGTFERNVGTTNAHVPRWKLTMRTRLRFAVVDTAANRIVDYVNLASDSDLDIANALTSGGSCGGSYTPDPSNGSMWCTNRMYGATSDKVPTFGIQNQIEASLGHTAPDWNSSTREFPSGMDQAAAIAFFKGQFQPGYLSTSNTFNAPYQPFRNIYLVTSWEANDPLVHYTVGDLVSLVQTNLMFDKADPSPTANLGQVNNRYEPWGGYASGSSSPTKVDLTVKDPLMFRSDNWDFPANKLPNVGWLGRVHRGTPWQTAYLKSFGVSDYKDYKTWFNNWQTWSGNGQLVTNVGQFSTNVLPLYVFGTATGVGWPDSLFTQPTNDWHLLDLFTTAFNDNATRGQLSVNQTNLAAWSAALSGVIVLTNNLDASGTPIFDATNNVMPAWTVIQPAGIYNSFGTTPWPPLVRLVNAINNTRNNNPRHVFSRLGDILAVPELTTASPFLNTNNTPSYYNNGLNDAAYERIPQQVAGLLKADSVPRFVIYAFGQTLKPESTRAIVKSGIFSGLCTNYQVVAESATRTVVRFDGVQPNHGINRITSLHPVIESFNVLPPD
jgi:hypothetical protein